MRQTSDWNSGLNNGKMRGSELDTLRNNLSNENWEWLLGAVYNAIDADEQSDQPNNIPFSKSVQFEERTEALMEITLSNGTTFSEMCKSKGRKASDFKALLWSILNVCMEILEYISFELPEYNSHNDVDSSLFVWS